MLKRLPLSVALCATSLAALAQTVPGAGQQLQQLPVVPPRTVPTPRLEIQKEPAPVSAPADASAIVVQRLAVTGASVYSESDLMAIAGFVPGQRLTLGDLNAMADRVTSRYRQDGYLVGRAYLPAQEVKDGVVTMAVLEGTYGNVKLNNASRLNDGVAHGILGGLNSGEVIASEPLESRLLQLSDLPGVEVRSTLVPGASLGQSDLMVDVVEGPRISGSVDADNAGNRYTGEVRVGATLNINNPAGWGDMVTLRALTSGPSLRYGRAAYQVPVGRGRVGVAVSQLDYELGKEFKPLDAHGRARTASLFGSYPLLRTRNSNHSVGLTLENRRFDDHVGAFDFVSEKHARVAVASIYGDHSDMLGGGGFNSYLLSLTAGDLDIRTPSVRATDATTARTHGGYGKLGFQLMRVQQVTASTSFMASVAGQVASTNLDSSEKMQLGGMYGVRAFPEGEASADQGAVLTLEARQLLPLSDRVPGHVQLVAFVDAGSVTLNKNPWSEGSNHRQLSGAGVGVYWARTNDFSLKAFYARPLGGDEATSAPHKSGRFWVQAVKYF